LNPARLSGCLCAIGLACVLVLPLRAWSQAFSENTLKAVLYFKLPQFVYLPQQANTSMPRICAMGGHAIVGAMEKVALNSTEGHATTLQVINSIGEASQCQFLFLSRAESGGYDTILQRLGRTRVVTVSDIPGFANAGGMIEFAQNADRSNIQIVINRKAARQQGIEFNAQLLRLARIVEP
jgi:hypothetical protein